MRHSDPEALLEVEGRVLLCCLPQAHMDEQRPGTVAESIIGVDGRAHSPTGSDTPLCNAARRCLPDRGAACPSRPVCTLPAAICNLLHYDTYLNAGLPIATGVIQETYRYLIKDRMAATRLR